MATTRRETKINRYKFNKAIVYIMFAALVVFGYVLGRVTAPEKVKVETVERVEIVEVPMYEAEALPADIEVKYYNIPLSHNLQKFIYEICADSECPISLILAVIEVESEFDQEIESDTGDRGLMQINEINYDQLAEEYRSADMFNPYQNVFCGVKILSTYIEKYDGDFTKALMCYNLGEYGARKAWESGIDSTDYTDKVLARMEVYQKWEW